MNSTIDNLMRGTVAWNIIRREDFILNEMEEGKLQEALATHPKVHRKLDEKRYKSLQDILRGIKYDDARPFEIDEVKLEEILASHPSEHRKFDEILYRSVRAALCMFKEDDDYEDDDYCGSSDATGVSIMQKMSDLSGVNAELLGPADIEVGIQ